MYQLLFLLLWTFTGSANIYDNQFTGIDGQNINLGDYRGKKILFVNTASASDFTSQYASLEQLYQGYKDSLVIIAFPSNSFGHESGSADDIKNFVSSNYNNHFLLAAPIAVTGNSTAQIFQWLTGRANNGTLDTNIKNDFYKFLVDGSGNLVGVFDTSVDPMSDAIQEVIKTNN